ncbi:hypothetical protein G3I71_49175 [Streptomyces sp. SID12501]|uniref:Uncharacterized protein n=2 Tax=Streptomyces sp. SID12501 TaxID=2706042 RepID=A0A6B3CAA2_9ACTN|nr:hypothetical protein [Streptomyces sp. SID12501]
MSRWIVLVSPVGGSPAESYRVAIHEELAGSPEDVEAAFLRILNTYEGEAWKVKRREIFKCSERSYVVRVHGRFSRFEYLFQLAELVSDTGDADLADFAG